MTIYPPLEIPETLAAGPGPGNTDPRVLERFAKTGLADHMQKDVLRGMIEAKEMLRELWGTKNVYTYDVGGTGFCAVDCVLSMILPGDTVGVREWIRRTPLARCVLGKRHGRHRESAFTCLHHGREGRWDKYPSSQRSRCDRD
jgi:hypothetical protein